MVSLNELLFICLTLLYNTSLHYVIHLKNFDENLRYVGYLCFTNLKEIAVKCVIIRSEISASACMVVFLNDPLRALYGLINVRILHSTIKMTF